MFPSHSLPTSWADATSSLITCTCRRSGLAVCHDLLDIYREWGGSGTVGEQNCGILAVAVPGAFTVLLAEVDPEMRRGLSGRSQQGASGIVAVRLRHYYTLNASLRHAQSTGRRGVPRCHRRREPCGT